MLATACFAHQDATNPKRYDVSISWEWPKETTKGGRTEVKRMVSDESGGTAIKWLEDQIAELLGCRYDDLKFLGNKRWLMGDADIDFKLI